VPGGTLAGADPPPDPLRLVVAVDPPDPPAAAAPATVVVDASPAATDVDVEPLVADALSLFLSSPPHAPTNTKTEIPSTRTLRMVSEATGPPCGATPG
jgi:hypothetical protein